MFVTGLKCGRAHEVHRGMREGRGVWGLAWGGEGRGAETHRGQAPPPARSRGDSVKQHLPWICQQSPPPRSRGDSDGKADRYGLFLARLTAMALILAVSARKTRPSSGKPQVAKTEAALHRRKECHNGHPCQKEAIAVSLATWERGRTSARRGLSPEGGFRQKEASIP